MNSPNIKQKQLLTNYKHSYLNTTAAILSANNTNSNRKSIIQSRAEEPKISNFEAQYWKKKSQQNKASIVFDEIPRKKDRNLEDLQKKFQIIQRHNTHLLAQNNSLTQMLSQKNSQMEILTNKFEIQLRGQGTHIIQIEQQKNKLVEEIQRKYYEHRTEIDKLLEEISKLHDQCYTIESTKNFELQKMKQTYEKETYTQIQNLKRSQNSSMELYETQIRKLKENLQLKNFELQTSIHHNKLNIDKLNEQIKHLEAEIKHLHQMKEIQLEECKIHYENEVQNKIRQLLRAQQLQNNTVEASIKKLKKQLSQKILEIQRLTNSVAKTNKQNDSQIQILKNQKQKLKLQISNLQSEYRESLRKQKDRLNNLSDFQKQNIENTNINYSNSLKSQIQKLYQLTQYKTVQIKNLYTQMENLKAAHSKQVDYLNKLLSQFKQKLDQNQLSTHEQLELLKIKMAQLHQADVKSVKQYFENQIKLLTQQLLDQQKVISQCREKIYQQLLNKNEIRKLFQIQISKQKSKYADLKLKYNATNLEMKSQLINVSSKIQLTSQTLLRQTKLKQQGTNFYEQQKRKLHQLIVIKDNELNELKKNIQRMKNEHIEQINRLNSQIQSLNKFNQQNDAKFKKECTLYENELKKKDIFYKRQIDQLNNEKKQIKTTTYNQLKFLIEKLQKEKVKLITDLENSQRDKASLTQELAVKNGLIQTLHLESSAAFQQQKQKMKGHWSKSQLSLKKYYDQKIRTRQAQLNAVKDQLNQKQQDLRDVIMKYNALEKRLSLLMQSQQKLRDFQNKVLNLGMDNNLIKNLAQLFKNKK